MFPVLRLIVCIAGFLLVSLHLASSSETDTGEREFRCSDVLKIGVIADNSSRVGKEQRIAIQIAAQNYHLSSCDTVELLLADSPENSPQTICTALDLITNKEVKALIGRLTRDEISVILELNKASINVPIISLSLASLVPPSTMVQKSPIIQMSDDITHHMQCIAAIVGSFKWRKVTVIYEERSYDFTTNMAILNLLSNSLRDVNSDIETQLGFSLSDSDAMVEEKLTNLSKKNSRVFIVVQASIELAAILFKNARKLNLMENRFIWIVSNEIANVLESLDSSSLHNMQGVIGFRTKFNETGESFKKFKTKFRRLYVSEYPEDEGQTDPSIFALRAYDAYSAMAAAMDKLQGKELPQKVLDSKFEGLSGLVSFKNGILSQLPTFEIINVIGKSYKVVAFWSPESGFSDILITQEKNRTTRNDTVDLPSLSQWPRGWNTSRYQKPLKIGVPTTAAFREFVQVNYNHSNGPHISGFSIDVFQAVVSNLRYFLPYEFVPINSSYDGLLQRVNKDLDGAVGDFGIFADRFKYVDFSEPYLNNAAVMIVKEEPLKWTKLWLFMKAFTPEMWLIMLSMHIFVSSVIWLIERKHNDELKGLGNMLWFSVSVIFFVHREPVINGFSRLVLGPWLFVILIITASFTASLSSMLTISRSQPSFVDIETLKLRNSTVGCNKNSVMVRFLTQVLNFRPENVRQIPAVDEFPAALMNGEIKAAFFSGPHADVFLAKNCKGYTKATIFKLVGMGFAFPRGSPLVDDMSASIAELIERREMPDLETTLISTFNCSSKDSNIDGSGLGPEPFAGLFLIAGVIALLAILFTSGRLVLMKLGWIREPISIRALIYK